MTEDKIRFSRRDFLKIIALASGTGLAVKYGLGGLSADEMVSETRLLMGTVVNISAVAPDPRSASVAINACFDRMTALEGVLSRFQPESQLSRLNQDGVLKDAHPVLVTLVKQSQELSQLTHGAFDITVKPLLDLYQKSASLPDKEMVQETLSLVDFQKLGLSGRTLKFQKSGMSITLDGIAKGFIVDEGIRVLKQSAFVNVLVEAGGDLMAAGEKYPHASWKIGLKAPRKEMGDLVATFNVQNQAIATSGDYLQAFTPDFANNHIIDPRSGYSSPEFASVSVFAPTAALADGLATAVMVMGREGIRLIENMPGGEAFAITKQAETIKTSGLN